MTLRVAPVIALLICAILLCGCMAQPSVAPSSVAEYDGFWSIAFHDTRLASLAADGREVVWIYTIEGALFKQGGNTPAGVYEGALLIRAEAEYFGFEPPIDESGSSSLPSEPQEPLFTLPEKADGWVMLADVSLEISTQDANSAYHEMAAQYDLALQQSAEGYTQQPLLQLGEIDEYRNAALAQAASTPVLYSSELLFFEAQRQGTEIGGYYEDMLYTLSVASGLPPSQSAALPTGVQYFASSQQAAGAASLPLWVEIFEDGQAFLYIGGLLPLGVQTPFVGRVSSGNVLTGRLPGMPQEQHSSSSSVGDGHAEMSPVQQTLEEYGLPVTTSAEVDGPQHTPYSTIVFTFENMTHSDAASYVRRLKLAGFTYVRSETEFPSIEFYSYVAGDGLGRQVSFLFRGGSAELALL